MNRVRQAVDALRRGLPVLVTDDADRENEGDVVMAADRASDYWMAWTVRHTSGLICAPMTAERADLLALPPMVVDNQDPKQTAYTVTVDAASGVSIGISAADRATTARVLADPAAGPTDLIRPGHVLPLRARPGGVLERPGHTEAAVDLCTLAGLPPVGVIAELVADDGTMMRTPGIEDLASRQGVPMLTIAELINFRSGLGRRPTPAPSERIERIDECALPTRDGPLRAVGYRDLRTGTDIVALVGGDPGSHNVLVRVHSECLTGESFGSQRCECGPQLDEALRRIATEGGVLIYLCGQEGRGIGLLKKLTAYRLQDDGLDTVAANVALDEPVDSREYGGAAAVLDHLGVRSVRLLTNNPDKIRGMQVNGIAVADRLPLHVGFAPANAGYLDAKRRLMGHFAPSGTGTTTEPCSTTASWPLLFATRR